MSPVPDPIDVALIVARELEAAGVAYTVGGSIASSVAGEPRSTIDIDVVAAIDVAQVPALVAAFSSEFYVDEEALLRAVRERGIANLIHQATQLRGGEISDRQWRDILAIVRVQGARLDRSYLQENAPALDVSDLLARALAAE